MDKNYSKAYIALTDGEVVFASEDKESADEYAEEKIVIVYL